MNIKCILFLFFSTSLVVSHSGWAADFITDTYTIENDNGHHQLAWEATPDAIVELQQATALDFSNAKTIYQGVDRASFISGLENGTYYFRVREQGDDWSPSLTLHVQHQSLQLAFTLFGVGIIVFLLTVLVVVNGTRKAAMAEST